LHIAFRWGHIKKKTNRLINREHRRVFFDLSADFEPID
jgi:hypothetical protein